MIMSNGSANPQNVNSDGNNSQNQQQNQQQNQPQQQQNQPQQQPQFQPQHHNFQAPTNYQPQQNSGPDTSALLGAINSIPEKIVHGFREAFTPAQQPQQQQQTGSGQSQQNGTQNSSQNGATGSQGSGGASGRGSGASGDRGNGEPGRKTFAEWWFGK